jgi:DNA-directed RNA polymerase subunit RPC12/RpoP
MFCPACGSPLENGYCPRCNATYDLDALASPLRRCPKCGGEMVFVRERKAGLLLLHVGTKSVLYRCSVCGAELSERSLGSMRNDKEFQEAKKALKGEIKDKIKKFVRE